MASFLVLCLSLVASLVAALVAGLLAIFYPPERTACLVAMIFFLAYALLHVLRIAQQVRQETNETRRPR